MHVEQLVGACKSDKEYILIVLSGLKNEIPTILTETCRNTFYTGIHISSENEILRNIFGFDRIFCKTYVRQQ